MIPGEVLVAGRQAPDYPFTSEEYIRPARTEHLAHFGQYLPRVSRGRWLPVPRQG